MLTLILFALTAAALAVGQLVGHAEPVAFVLCVAWGVWLYSQHGWMTDAGVGEYATPGVLFQGVVLALLVAMVGSWPLFCVAASIPVQVLLLRKLRARLPVGP